MTIAKTDSGTVKFGVGQLSNPTPVFVKNIFRAFALISGIWAILPPDMLHLAPTTLAEVNKWIIISNPLILFITKFFGWDYTPTYGNFDPNKTGN